MRTELLINILSVDKNIIGSSQVQKIILSIVQYCGSWKRQLTTDTRNKPKGLKWMLIAITLSWKSKVKYINILVAPKNIFFLGAQILFSPTKSGTLLLYYSHQSRSGRKIKKMSMIYIQSLLNFRYTCP